MTPEPPPHPALAVLDERIKVSKGLFDVAYSAAQTAEAHSRWMGERVDLLVELRDEIMRAMADKPAPVVKRGRRPRRTKAEMKAAREKTLAATAEAGLVKPMEAADDKAAQERTIAAAKDAGLLDAAGMVKAGVAQEAYPDAVAVPPEMRRG